MFVHSVFFWLKKSLSDAEREYFASELKKLTTITPAHFIGVGTPASTDRPIIDKSYDYSITGVFNNQADHDAYQIDPVHLLFKPISERYVEKLIIYDAD